MPLRRLVRREIVPPERSSPNGPALERAGSAPLEVLTIREVAAYLRLPLSTVYRLAERRVLPGHKIGRQWRFHRSVLEDWFRQQAATARATLLVVDPDESTRQQLVAGLQSGRDRVLAAATGKEALEIAESTRLDLVILDAALPGASGAETFRGLRAVRPELPVVLLAGSRDGELLGEILDVGPFTLVSKPADAERIRKVVGLTLGG